MANNRELLLLALLLLTSLNHVCATSVVASNDSKSIASPSRSVAATTAQKPTTTAPVPTRPRAPHHNASTETSNALQRDQPPEAGAALVQFTNTNAQAPLKSNSTVSFSFAVVVLVAICAMVLLAVMSVMHVRRFRLEHMLQQNNRELQDYQQQLQLQNQLPDQRWINPMLSTNSMYDYNSSCSPTGFPRAQADIQDNSMQRNVTGTPIVALLHSHRAEDRDSFNAMGFSHTRTEFYKSIGTPSQISRLQSKHYHAPAPQATAQASLEQAHRFSDPGMSQEQCSHPGDVSSRVTISSAEIEQVQQIAPSQDRQRQQKPDHEDELDTPTGV